MHASQEHARRKRSFTRTARAHGLLGVAAACLVVGLQACTQPADVNSGVMLASVEGETLELVGEPAGAPVWAPQGDAIVWATEDGLYRRDLTANAPELLSTRAAAGRPSWSPDGGTLAFVDGEAESLAALDASTGEIRFEIDVSTPGANHRPLALPILGGPGWSPDGTRVAFNCWDGHGDEICVVEADGSGFFQVTHIQQRRGAGEPAPGALVFASSNAGPPAWSPDGNALAIGVYPEQRGAAAGVFVVDLEAGAARRVSQLLPNSEIRWFADGESLLFSARDEGRSDVFRVPVGGGDVARLTASLEAGAREPALSLDQQHLAVVSGGDVAILDLQGNVRASIDGALVYQQPAWSAQGSWIAFAAAPDDLESYS